MDFRYFVLVNNECIWKYIDYNGELFNQIPILLFELQNYLKEVRIHTMINL